MKVNRSMTVTLVIDRSPAHSAKTGRCFPFPFRLTAQTHVGCTHSIRVNQLAHHRVHFWPRSSIIFRARRRARISDDSTTIFIDGYAR